LYDLKNDNSCLEQMKPFLGTFHSVLPSNELMMDDVSGCESLARRKDHNGRAREPLPASKQHIWNTLRVVSDTDNNGNRRTKAGFLIIVLKFERQNSGLQIGASSRYQLR
jgi:hypothetical protein